MTDEELPAGHELDACVAAELMNWPAEAFAQLELPRYSTVRSEAWVVETRMFADGYTCHTYGCRHTTDAPWAATFAKGPNSYHASAQTVELAICRAGIKAVRKEPK